MFANTKSKRPEQSKNYFQIPTNADVKAVPVISLPCVLQHKFFQLDYCTTRVIVVSPVLRCTLQANPELTLFDDLKQRNLPRKRLHKSVIRDIESRDCFIPIKSSPKIAFKILQLAHTSYEKKALVHDENKNPKRFSQRVVGLQASALYMYNHKMYLLPKVENSEKANREQKLLGNTEEAKFYNRVMTDKSNPMEREIDNSRRTMKKQNHRSVIYLKEEDIIPKKQLRLHHDSRFSPIQPMLGPRCKLEYEQTPLKRKMADCRENNGVKKNSKRFGSSRKHGQEMTSVMAQSSTKERPPLSTRYLSAPELSPNFSYCPTWFSSSDKSSGLTGTSLSSKISRRDPWIPQGTSTPEGSMSPDSVSSSSFQSISSDTLPSSECEEEETSPYQKYSTPEINRALNLASEKQDETTNEMLQQLQTPFKRKKADFRNKEDVNPLGSGIKYGQEMVPGFACTSTETLSPATSKASLNFSHHPSWFQPSMESSSSNLKPGSPCPSLIISTDASSSYECDDDDEDGSFLYTEFFKQEPNQEPSRQPNREPNQEPGREPNRKPNREHKQEPGREPNQEPSCEPNQNPRQEPNRELNQEPNQKPCRELNQELNRGPNHKPNREPNQKAKEKPNQEPGQKPKQEPFKEPNQKPSHEPNQKPRRELNREPKQNTSQEHNREPNQKPGQRPNQEPNQKPGRGPNQEPTQEFNREPNLKFVHQKGETTKDEIPHQFQALVKEEMTRDTCNFLFEGTLTRSSFPSLSVSTGIEHNRDRGSPSVESSAFDLKREPNFASFHQPNETTNADILQQLQDTTTCARDVSPSSLPSSSLASSDASTDTSSGSEYDEDESSSDLASVHQQDEMAKEKILQKLQECIPFQTKIAKIKEREDVERHLYPLGSNVNHEQKETRSTKEHQPPLAMHPSTQDVSISLPHGSAWLPPSTKCSGQTRTSLSNEICSTDPLPSEAAGVNKICISRSPMPSSPCSSLSISTDTSSSSEYDDDGTSLSDESSATETNQERNLAFVDETTKDEILQRLQERWREMNQRVEDIRNKKST